MLEAWTLVQCPERQAQPGSWSGATEQIPPGSPGRGRAEEEGASWAHSHLVRTARS